MSYPDMAYEVISRFVGPEDVPAETLKDIIKRSFSTFRTPGKYLLLIPLSVIHYRDIKQ